MENLPIESRIFVAGHHGMVGSAIVRKLMEMGYSCILTRRHSELDLRSQEKVDRFFQENAIDYVVLAAAKVGGIKANSDYPAEFLYDNLMIECNVIHSAFNAGVKNLLFLGSSCIYPKFASQPIKEGELLAGMLESTNEPYAIAKIAGIKLCESYNRQYGTDYRSVMPTNLYGPNDNYHPENSHVIPALIRRIHEAVINKASEVVIWGSGTPRREFLHVDDLASACIHIMRLSRSAFKGQDGEIPSHVNVGTGTDISIRELAELLAEEAAFTGGLIFDTSKPDGTPKKQLDVSLMKRLGWEYQIGLREGLAAVYADYVGSGKR